MNEHGDDVTLPEYFFQVGGGGGGNWCPESTQLKLCSPKKRPPLVMNQSNRSLNIPPRAYPGHLTPLPAQEGGHLMTSLRGGEFDRHPRFHAMSRTDFKWVDKSWRRGRRGRRQTLMNLKEKIAYSWRIG